MGNYCILLFIVSEIYFSKKEDDVFNKIKIIFEKNKNLDLNTVFFYSNINLINLVISRQYTRILNLIIKYDKKQLTLNIINKAIYNDNQLLNTLLLKNYRKSIVISNNLSNNKNYILILERLLNKCIIYRCINNFKIICNEIYKIDYSAEKIIKILSKYKNKQISNPKIKTLINYPALSLPYNRSYVYPKNINQCLNLILSINLPIELINIICNYYIISL
jgi:hypothetical protein